MTATTTALTALIETRQLELGIVDSELALALGYEHERVFELIKKGRLRLPMNKIGQLATALSLDPLDVLRVAMDDAAPGLLDIIKAVLNPLNLTKSEARLIQHCRKLANGRPIGPMVIDGKGVIALITL